jgi:hypothetical protein
LSWRISSGTSRADEIIGFVTLHIFSILLPCLVYYFIYTSLSVENINAIIVFNQQALQWIQSFDSPLHYGAWAIYILSFAIILSIFALPIYLLRKAAKRKIDKINMLALFAITLLTAIIGWRKFDYRTY